MRKILIIFLLIFFMRTYSSIYENKIIEIVIYKVDFNILTPFSWECVDFLEIIGNKTIPIKISDVNKINEFQELLESFEFSNDRIKNIKNIDTRAKVYIFYENRFIDTICVNRDKILFNDKNVKSNLDFIEFIKNIK